jgi:hypothetical protein
MTQRIHYVTEQQDVDQQKKFYAQGDIMVNVQKVPYRLTKNGWVLIPEEEWLKIIGIRIR